VGELGSIPVPMTAAPADASYDRLCADFVRYTRADIAALLVDLAARLRSGRYPTGRPYRHVNGFTKIVVAEHPAARLTLHFWPADPGAPDDVSRPHDHRFGFSSLLLDGTQRFVEFESGPAGARPDQAWRRYEYRPFLRGRFATVTGHGTLGLRPVRVVERTAMDGHYTTSSTVVHQAVTSRATACATLVLRGPRERRTSNVYYRPAEPPPRGGLQFGRHLGHDEVVRQVDHVAARVSTM
jgi:hypothetical protein